MTWDLAKVARFWLSESRTSTNSGEPGQFRHGRCRYSIDILFFRVVSQSLVSERCCPATKSIQCIITSLWIYEPFATYDKCAVAASQATAALNYQHLWRSLPYNHGNLTEPPQGHPPPRNKALSIKHWFPLGSHDTKPTIRCTDVPLPSICSCAPASDMSVHNCETNYEYKSFI